MTKEELIKEATEYALEWGDKTDGTYACCRDGYLAGAEPREKRIAHLEAQIEQLTYLHNEDVKTIKLLNKQIKEIKEND